MRSSQTGSVPGTVDGDDHANFIAYGSKNCRNFTKSFEDAEALSFVNSSDQAVLNDALLETLARRTLELDDYMKSRTASSCVAKNISVLEKRLQVDVAPVHMASEREQMRYLGWVLGA